MLDPGGSGGWPFSRVRQQAAAIQGASKLAHSKGGPGYGRLRRRPGRKAGIKLPVMMSAEGAAHLKKSCRRRVTCKVKGLLPS
jgi:hypothetical protein